MNNKILRNVFASILTFAIILCLSLVTSCKDSALSRTFFAADTICTITLYDGNEAALDGAVELCNSLVKTFDANSEDSPLYRLNTEKVLEDPDEDLYILIKKATEYAKRSDGVFDPTVRAFTELWDFNSNILPDGTALETAAQKVGYKNISVTKEKITLLGDTKLELGAIAKGYISDKVYNYLKEQGVTSAIINLGGNVSLLGNNNGEKISVGIQKPFSDDIIVTVYTEDTSVVTSGIYQRYIEKDNIIYHHLLNSKTGWPEQNDLASVTIISKSGTDADALSTLCFLLGKEKGMKYIEDLQDTEAVFVDRDNNIYLTSGLMQNENMIAVSLK